MADNKKQVVIIKKKRGGEAHGAHGGAWKVAYADFVTAMMAFFLVMWLMGADEDTKASIEHYFNHPHTPWSAGADPNSTVVYPLGEREGQGENVLEGMDGQVPDDLVERVARPKGSNEKLQLNREVKELIEEVMEGQAYGIDVSIEFMKFSIPSKLLFDEGKTEVKASARRVIGKVGQIFRGYPGYITIEGHTQDKPKMTRRYTNTYEFSLARAVAVMDYLVENKWTREDKLVPSGKGPLRKYSKDRAPASAAKNDRIEFTLSLTKQY